MLFSCTRQSQDNEVIRFRNVVPRIEFCKNFFRFRCTTIWNAIPKEILEIDLSPTGSNNTFKKMLKTWYSEKLDLMDNDNVCTWITDCKWHRCRLV